MRRTASLNKAYLVILASFAWLIGGGVVISLAVSDPESAVLDYLMWALLIGFSVIFLAGTATWAVAKGYHPGVGIALGWLGPPGLIVLVFLRDRSNRVDEGSP